MNTTPEALPPDHLANGWLQTATGRAFWPLAPRPQDIDIVDIAHALANQCRYAGHCRKFYSVAEHSVHVARHLPPEFKLWGLLHDASEAYLVDIPRPIKPALTNYRALEDRVMAAVAEAFGLAGEMPAEVKRADNAILADEAAQLMGNPPKAWGLTEAPLGVTVRCWSPRRARASFLTAFAEYKIGGAA